MKKVSNCCRAETYGDGECMACTNCNMDCKEVDESEKEEWDGELSMFNLNDNDIKSLSDIIRREVNKAKKEA